MTPGTFFYSGQAGFDVRHTLSTSSKVSPIMLLISSVPCADCSANFLNFHGNNGKSLPGTTGSGRFDIGVYRKQRFVQPISFMIFK